MNKIIHNVLGTPYTVKVGSKEELNMSDDYMGECRVYSKEILVCSERGGCTDEELKVKTQEILAHEIFHAYINESGVDLEESEEEKLASFFMKTWRKMTNSILEILDKTNFLE